MNDLLTQKLLELAERHAALAALFQRHIEEHHENELAQRALSGRSSSRFDVVVASAVGGVIVASFGAALAMFATHWH